MFELLLADTAVVSRMLNRVVLAVLVAFAIYLAAAAVYARQWGLIVGGIGGACAAWYVMRRKAARDSGDQHSAGGA